VEQINTKQSIEADDKNKSNKNKTAREEREREHKNLFTQFGLMMTYSGGESSSPFHYNDMSFFTKRCQRVTRISLQT
jgi:hypothetical protein